MYDLLEPEASLHLSPCERIGALVMKLDTAYFLKPRFDNLAPRLSLAIQTDPGALGRIPFLAACCAEMERLKEAPDVVLRLRAITAFVLQPVVALRNPEHSELFLPGQRLAIGAAD